MLALNLGNAEQHPGHQMADRAGQVDLLGNGHNPHSGLAPFGKDIYSLLHRAGHAIQFPHDNGSDGLGKDRLTQGIETAPPQRCACLDILKPLHRVCFVAVRLKPSPDFGVLAVAFLRVGRNPDVNTDTYGKLNYTLYFHVSLRFFTPKTQGQISHCARGP